MRAVEKMEKAAERVVAPKISGAWRTMMVFWPKIRKAKVRMTTPSMLISQFPAPQASEPCSTKESVSSMQVSMYVCVCVCVPNPGPD